MTRRLGSRSPDHAAGQDQQHLRQSRRAPAPRRPARLRVLCSRTAFFCAFSDWLGARRGVPQDELNAGQLRIHRKFIAILLLPLVLLAALAAGRIRSNVPQGVRAGASEHPGRLEEVDGMAWTRTRRRWTWALVLVLAALALAVPLTVARRQEPTPRGTPLNVRLDDFRVRRDAAVVPAGIVSFRILNEGPTTHEVIVVRTDRVPGKLPLQPDGLTVDEEGEGIDFLEEVEGLDINDRQTLDLRMAPGHYVLYCNLQGHYLGGMYAALTVG